MSNFAHPIRRGDFLYSSILYADPGNANHHPRTSVAELAALLRPEAPSLYSGGRKPEPSFAVKDPPWHFYSAQLIHYGLPITKNKNGAKVRLLNAMNHFKLEVSAWVLKVEGELKKEWESENRKMKKAAGSGAATKKESGAKGKGKVTPSDPSKVNVTVKLSLSSGMSMAEQLGIPQHSQSTTPKKPSPTERKRSDSDTPTKSVKIKKEQTPRKSMTHMKQEQPFPSLHKPPARPRFKQEHTSPATILLSGRYGITCATATSLFGTYDLDLALATNLCRTTWWATFRWGAWDGIIQLNPGPSYTPLGQPCPLGWHMRNLETGQLKFGKRCTGAMTFFEAQTFVGWLGEVPGAGTVEFEGTRLAGQGLEDDLQEEWDLFVEEAYGR